MYQHFVLPPLRASTVKAPTQCALGELQAFVELVCEGGEVAVAGLEGRVRRARLLSFLHESDSLVGVAGIKLPSINHRTEVEAGSGVKLSECSYPLELGWVFVRTTARGGGAISLCTPLMEAIKGDGIFATSRVNNHRMHATLVKLGFEREGDEWASGQNSVNLCMFKRTANDS